MNGFADGDVLGLPVTGFSDDMVLGLTGGAFVGFVVGSKVHGV